MKLITLLLLSLPLAAQDFNSVPQRNYDKLYKISVVSLISASTADFVSSIGGIEANPTMRGSNGTFHMGKGLAWKSGMLAANFGFQVKFMKRHKKAAAIMNFVAAGAFATITGNNLRLRSFN